MYFYWIAECDENVNRENQIKNTKFSVKLKEKLIVVGYFSLSFREYYVTNDIFKSFLLNEP